jgi:hypothetical protein
MEFTARKWIKKISLLVLVLALLAPAGCMTDVKGHEEMRQEIKDLKAEIKALQEKVAKLEAGQQQIMNNQQQILKSLATPPAPAKAAPPPAPEALTVGQLLREKDRLIGTRVTVRAMPGPVVVHRKTILLKAPEGLVEVYFGDLPDVRTVNRLTSTTLDKPLTITGVLNPPARGGGNLRIIAEVIEF